MWLTNALQTSKVGLYNEINGQTWESSQRSVHSQFIRVSLFKSQPTTKKHLHKNTNFLGPTNEHPPFGLCLSPEMHVNYYVWELQYMPPQGLALWGQNAAGANTMADISVICQISQCVGNDFDWTDYLELFSIQNNHTIFLFCSESRKRRPLFWPSFLTIATVQSMLTLWFREFHFISHCQNLQGFLRSQQTKNVLSEVASIRIFHDFYFGRSLVSVALWLNCPIHFCLIQRTILIRAEEFTFRFILITNPKISIFCRNWQTMPAHNVNTPWLCTYETSSRCTSFYKPALFCLDMGKI